MSGCAVALCSAALVAPPAHAETALRWSVPERLQGGTAGVARSVANAAQPGPTVIVLRTCAHDPAWKLDGDDVDPKPAGRCAYRLDLGDHDEHTLELEAGDDTVKQDVRARDLLIVSIGDSVASGEGNPDVPSAVAPRWLERRCHRSMRSGAAQAALAVAAGDEHSSISFLPLACSGATVSKGLLGPYDGVEPNPRLGDLPAQVGEVAALARRRPIDALLLSVGANDVYFGPLARFCLAVASCPRRRFDPDEPGGEASEPGAPTMEQAHADAQEALPGRYDQLAGALDRAGVKPEKVIIVEYFDPTHDEHGDTCEALLPGITTDETQFAQDAVLGPLNAAVAAAALRHEWKLVAGVPEAFADHGICARAPLRWVRRIEESLLRGSALSGPLHPNSAGHLATAALIAPVLADVVGVDPGDAVAQSAGAADNEGSEVAWWWLPIAAALGAGAVLLVLLLRRRLKR